MEAQKEQTTRRKMAVRPGESPKNKWTCAPMTFRSITPVLTNATAISSSPWRPPNGQEHETRALHRNRSWTGDAPVQKLAQEWEDEREWLPFRGSTVVTLNLLGGHIDSR